MTEKEIEAIELALKVVDGDEEKATALLELLSLQPLHTSPIKGKLNLPDESCVWCKDEGDCWVDMPDSKRKCEGNCSRWLGIQYCITKKEGS